MDAFPLLADSYSGFRVPMQILVSSDIRSSNEIGHNGTFHIGRNDNMAYLVTGH